MIRQQRIFYRIIKKLNIAVARLARDLQINGLVIVVIHLVVWLAIVDLSAVSRSYYPQSTPDTPTLAGRAAALAAESTEVKVTGASHVGFTLHFMNLNTVLTCAMPPQRHWQTGLRPRFRNARLDSVFATGFFLKVLQFFAGNLVPFLRLPGVTLKIPETEVELLVVSLALQHPLNLLLLLYSIPKPPHHLRRLPLLPPRLPTPGPLRTAQTTKITLSKFILGVISIIIVDF